MCIRDSTKIVSISQFSLGKRLQSGYQVISTRLDNYSKDLNASFLWRRQNWIMTCVLVLVKYSWRIWQRENFLHKLQSKTRAPDWKKSAIPPQKTRCPEVVKSITQRNTILCMGSYHGSPFPMSFKNFWIDLGVRRSRQGFKKVFSNIFQYIMYQFPTTLNGENNWIAGIEIWKCGS